MRGVYKSIADECADICFQNVIFSINKGFSLYWD